MTQTPPKQARKPRRIIISITALALTGLIGSTFNSGPTLMLWNATASVPIGLYSVHPGAPLGVDDLAVTRLPTGPKKLAEARGYLSTDVLLIKPVAAIPGSDICRSNLQISVNGRHMADALEADQQHRPLPQWRGCRRLGPDEFFLMNPNIPDSFDGRYFGATDRHLIEGRARPLFIIEARPSR